MKTQDGKIMHAENIHIFNLKTICIIWRFLNTFLKKFKVNTGVLLSANVVLFLPTEEYINDIAQRLCSKHGKQCFTSPKN